MIKFGKSEKSVGEEIAMWFLREVKKDGVFANLIVPAAVSFITDDVFGTQIFRREHA